MPLILDLLPVGNPYVHTNMGVSEGLFNDARIKLDISAYTQAKLRVWQVGATSSVNNPRITAKYATTDTITLASYNALGTSAIEIALSASNNDWQETSWIDIAAAAISAGTVYVCLTATGGDSLADPSYGSVALLLK